MGGSSHNFATPAEAVAARFPKMAQDKLDSLFTGGSTMKKLEDNDQIPEL